MRGTVRMNPNRWPLVLLIFQAAQHLILRSHPAPVSCRSLGPPEDVGRAAMLGRIVDIASVWIADLADRAFALPEWTGARSDHAHPGNHEIEPPPRPAAVGTFTLRGDRRVMRRDVQVHVASRKPEGLRHTYTFAHPVPCACLSPCFASRQDGLRWAQLGNK